MMGKILAIDFGLKRTGIAISDDSKFFAFGYKTIPSVDLEKELNQLTKKEKIEIIVLGQPKKLDNSDTHISENVNLLKQRLTNLFPQIKIELYDERFTSKMAFQSLIESGVSKKKRADKALIDEVSATIILQSFLQFKKN